MTTRPIRTVEEVRLPDGATLVVTLSRRPDADGMLPPVVLMHGGPGLWDYLEPVDDLLAEVPLVVHYDQRGCGRSSPSDEQSMERYVADLDALRSHLGLTRVAVIGHSFGAALALAYAAAHPERTAVVVHLSGVGIGDWHAAFRAERTRRRIELGITDRIAELDARPRTADEEIEWRRLVWATDYADPRRGLTASTSMARTPRAVNQHANREVTFADADLIGWAAGVRCPVFFVHGSADPATRRECDATRRPDAVGAQASRPGRRAPAVGRTTRRDPRASRRSDPGGSRLG